MPPKRGPNSKIAAQAPVKPVPAKIEIPLPSSKAYVPGSGPPSEPISLTPRKDSTAYILDKFLLPKLSECRPGDRRLVYYLVGFTDLPVVRILVPCHKAQEYVDPRTIEEYEEQQHEKLMDERARLEEEAAKKKRKAGRPAKVKGVPTELDYSKPSPYGTVTTTTPAEDNSEENTVMLDTQLTGPSLSTPQKRNRPSLDGGAGPSDTSTAPFTSTNQLTTNRRSVREEEAVKRQLFYESTKHRLSPSYTPPTDSVPLQPGTDMGQSDSGPSSRASPSAGLPVPSVSSASNYGRRSTRSRPGSAATSGSGTPQVHPDWANIMKFSNKVMDIMDKKSPDYNIQPADTATTSAPPAANDTGNNTAPIHPALATWGSNRFPLPNSQGFLPIFTSPPAQSAEPSHSQKDKKRSTTESVEPDAKPKKKRRTSNQKSKKEESEEESWAVKHLLRDEVRVVNGRRTTYYLVQWTGDWAPTWEPASNITKDLIKTYKAQKEAGTLPPLPENYTSSAVGEAFRGGINENENDDLVRDDEEEEEEQLWVTDPATTSLPGSVKKPAPA
ncbi:hypothetical protein V8F20_011267 [Naviculisporaceae sp. PSN 640]